jgi:hypothetical protein
MLVWASLPIPFVVLGSARVLSDVFAVWFFFFLKSPILSFHWFGEILSRRFLLLDLSGVDAAAALLLQIYEYVCFPLSPFFFPMHGR